MSIILGIDTGGTYTDGVMLQADTKRLVRKTKTLTTRRRLQVCIKNCISSFSPEDLADVSLVCLSTTLATNAIVEGRGCREGLILIGGRPEGKIPTERYCVVQGRPDILGRMREHIDLAEIDAAIESFRGQVDALAVSGYASVRNPEHEILVKERIREKLGIPVACAHELTTSLGFYDRTITVDLNAKLIPLICDLIDSVKKVLAQFDVDAPLMIVKGDGTLMTEACAREIPIETILSGPAASVIGGMFLSNQQDAIILDMGGTTTDIANITGGKLQMNNEGAKVGGWLTRIRATEIFTVGLGGDSRIFLDGNRELCVGPRKVIPYCLGTTWFPSLQAELQEIYNSPLCEHQKFWRNEQEAFMVSKYFDYSDRNQNERTILDALQTNPHTFYHLQVSLGLGNLASSIEHLISENILTRIALSPTDLLHASGEYIEWNRDSAALAVHILAEQLGMTVETCLCHANERIYRALNCSCIQSSFYYDRESFDIDSSEAADYFVNSIFLQNKSSILGAQFYLKKPVVAIGAPVRAWSKELSHALNAQVIVPEHADVANAVGAAVAQAIDEAEILIRLDPVTKQYTVFTAECRCAFDSLDAATDYARETGRRLASAHLPNMHSTTDQIEDVSTTDRMTGMTHFVERRVTVTAYSESTHPDSSGQSL